MKKEENTKQFVDTVKLVRQWFEDEQITQEDLYFRDFIIGRMAVRINKEFIPKSLLNELRVEEKPWQEVNYEEDNEASGYNTLAREINSKIDSILNKQGDEGNRPS